MRSIQQNTEDLPLLRNGKPHVSYSEVSTWQSCPWKHKLVYIDGLSEDEPSPYLDYGTIIHDAVENFLKTREMNIEQAHQKIRDAWKRRGFDTEEFVVKQTARAASQNWKYKHANLDVWLRSATNSLEQLPSFLDENFPGWKPVAAEHMLYETIDPKNDGKFKGFIDCILELPNGKHVVIDWKTAGPRGWNRSKQSDFLTQAQIILYKNYWMEVTGLPSSKVKACFVLLKRESKPGKSVALVEISAGPKALAKATKMVRGMLTGMKAKFVIKNKLSCRFCEFSNTHHCP